jgi:hypothetical protein
LVAVARVRSRAKSEKQQAGSARQVLPNPSLKGRSNGVPPSPGHRVAFAHFLWPGLGVPPSASPLVQTLGIESAGVHCSSRVSALRRELNSHGAASREGNGVAAIEHAEHPDDHTPTSTPDQKRVRRS